MGNSDFNKQTLYTIYTIYTLQFLPLAPEESIGNLVEDLDFIQNTDITVFFLFFYHNKVIAFNYYSDFKCIMYGHQ